MNAHTMHGVIDIGIQPSIAFMRDHRIISQMLAKPVLFRVYLLVYTSYPKPVAILGDHPPIFG